MRFPGDWVTRGHFRGTEGSGWARRGKAGGGREEGRELLALLKEAGTCKICFLLAYIYICIFLEKFPSFAHSNMKESLSLQTQTGCNWHLLPQGTKTQDGARI